MSLTERRRESHGWDTFPVSSGRYLCTFVMKALDIDLGVFGAENRADREREGGRVVTRLLLAELMDDTIRDLGTLVHRADRTAAALVAHGGGEDTPDVVIAALRSGEWPDAGRAASEAAAFSHRLLVAARQAKTDGFGVCWEYRGEVVV